MIGSSWNSEIGHSSVKFELVTFHNEFHKGRVCDRNASVICGRISKRFAIICDKKGICVAE